MATLAFNVEADYEKVIRLRDEIARLEVELNKVAQNGTPEEIGRLESQLESCRTEMKEAVKTASELGASIEESVKSANFTSVQAQVDALTYAIGQSEAEMARTAIELNNLREQGQKAFDAGDTAGLDAINQQIGVQVNQYKELQEATERYKQALQGLTEGGVDTSLEGLSAVMLQIGDACQREESVIAQLEKEYQSLNTRLVMNVQQGTEEHKNILERMQAVQGEISVRKELVAELKAQDEELELAVQKMREQNKVAQENGEQHASLRTQIRLLKEQMADMRANGIDEQSDAYRRLAQELGRLQDIQGDIQRQGSILANDERSFAGITSGLQGMSSGFLAVQGAMMLFGEENQKLQSVLMKTHAIMSMVNALQQVSAMLNKDSAFRLVTLANAREWWNKLLDVGRGKQIADTVATQANTVAKQANTVAKQANTAAQQGNSVATGTNTAAQTAQTGAAVAGTAANIGLAGAFRMVGAAIKSIPVFGWIAAAIGAIVAVTATFIKRANEAKKKAQEFYKALADEVYKPVASVRQLANEWEKLGDSLEAKEKYIAENRQRFDELGVSIRNVNDADKLLVDNADAFIKAQVAKAKATILLQQAMDKTKDLAELQMEIDSMPDTYTTWNSPRAQRNTRKESKQAQADELEAEIKSIYDQIDEYNAEYSKTLADNGLATTREAVAGSANEIKKQIQELQEEMDNDFAVGSNEYNKRKKQIEELQKQLNGGDNGGGSRTTTRVTDNSEREAKEREKIQKRLNESLLSMQAQNQQAEIDLMDEGTEKKLAQIEHSYKLQIAKIEELAKEMAEANAKAGVTGTNDNGLTQEQQEGVDKATENANAERVKAEQAVYEAEKDAMLAYLKEYGTYQQKKLAIAEEYAKKIAEAQTEGERMTYERQRTQALGNLEAETLKLDIDWTTIFSEFGGILGTTVSAELDKLRSYRNTAEFQSLDARTQGELIRAIDKLEQSLGGGNLNFKQLGKDTEAYHKSLRELNDAKQTEAELVEELVKAQDDLRKAIEKGTDAEQEEAQQRVTDAQANANAQAQVVETLQVATDEARENMLTSAEKLRTGMNGVLEGMSQATAGGLSNAFNGTIKAISSVNKSFEEIVESTKSVPIIGWILSIIDLFKDGLSELLGPLLEAIFDAISGIIGDIFNGNLFKTIGEQLLQGIGNIFNAITLGGFKKWFGWGESDPHYERNMERLSLTNEALKESVDRLADVMSDSTTSITEAYEAYETQIENVNQQMANTQQQMQRSGSAYSNGVWGVGGHHSSNTKINDAMSTSEWAQISEVVGTSVTSASDFWKLTSEQMYKVRTEASTLYAKIKQYADNGYKDAAQYMDEYTEYWLQLQELEDEYREKLTNTSFDSLTSSFKEAISDMSRTSADFADDFEDLMKNAVIDSMMTSKYNKDLEKWYEDFAKAMESDETLTPQEQQDLKDSYMDIVNDARDELEGLYDTLGWSRTSYSQQGTSGGWETMSEDTGQELNGRFTALQETGVGLLTESKEQTEWARNIYEINAQIQNTLVDSYLELQEINDNTRDTVTQLLTIAKYIKSVKENTDKL